MHHPVVGAYVPIMLDKCLIELDELIALSLYRLTI